MDQNAKYQASPRDNLGHLVGSWVTSLTWGILLMQFIGYMRTWQKDPRVLRGAVLFLFANESATTTMTLIGTYKILLNTPPNSLQALTVPDISSAGGFLNAITNTGVNWYLLWRFQRLGRKWWISCPLFALTLASFACICWTTQLGFHVSAIVTSGTDLERVDIIMQQITEGLKVAYGLEVLIVTATVAALVAEVARRASSDLPTAGQLVKRLLVVNLSSGALTAAVAMVTFVDAAREAPNFLIIEAACVSRSYFMSMLFHLAMRDSSIFKPKHPSLGHISTSLIANVSDSAKPIYKCPPLVASDDQGTDLEYASVTTEAKEEGACHGPPPLPNQAQT